MSPLARPTLTAPTSASWTRRSTIPTQPVLTSLFPCLAFFSSLCLVQGLCTGTTSSSCPSPGSSHYGRRLGQTCKVHQKVTPPPSLLSSPVSTFGLFLLSFLSHCTDFPPCTVTEQLLMGCDYSEIGQVIDGRQESRVAGYGYKAREGWGRWGRNAQQIKRSRTSR